MLVHRNLPANPEAFVEVIAGEAARAAGFQLLRSIPGTGKVLAMTILYEIHDIRRFDRVQEFASYARLVRCAKESAGKKHGTSGAKMGNVHLKWAFSEAAVLFVRHGPEARSGSPGSSTSTARARP